MVVGLELPCLDVKAGYNDQELVRGMLFRLYRTACSFLPKKFELRFCHLSIALQSFSLFLVVIEKDDQFSLSFSQIFQSGLRLAP